MQRALVLVGFALLVSMSSLSLAQEAKPKPKPKPNAITDPAQAGPDFAIQGEYVGEIEVDDTSMKLGAQVIALGDGKFNGVFFVGGLPGAGWVGEIREEVEAASDNGVVVFNNADKGKGVLKDGVITVYLAGSEKPIGELKKTERASSTLGKKAPAGAVVLFDGTSADNFKNGRMTDDGLLMEGVTSNQTFGDCQLHLEFLLPFMPTARGQGRSNSGVYMQGRYEVQVLDSFGLKGLDNECGGIYKTSAPKVNMCLPPLVWQTYDIDYTAAKFDANGAKTADARITVRHNDVVIQDDVELPAGTQGGPNKVGPEAGPLFLQNHGNPVRFRNIWLIDKATK